MINFSEIKTEGSEPIYAQLIKFVKRGLASGEIAYGDEMPSRRVLSASLGINPNTVQKAYALLEAEKIITSHPGAKSLVCADEEKIVALRAELTEAGARTAIATLKAAGYSKDEAIAVLEKYWDLDSEAKEK